MRTTTSSSSFVNLVLPLTLAIFIISFSLTAFNSTTFAQNTNNNTNQISSNIDTRQGIIPSAESVYQSQSMTLPPSVRAFVWYIVDEAHENSANERHKYVSDHNPIYLPTNLTIPQGTLISFLDADAPWDTPHPHTINLQDSSGNVVYTTGKMDYTNASIPKVLPAGKYSIMDTKYTWMRGNITVSSNQKSTGNLTRRILHSY